MNLFALAPLIIISTLGISCIILGVCLVGGDAEEDLGTDFHLPEGRCSLTGRPCVQVDPHPGSAVADDCRFCVEHMRHAGSSTDGEEEVPVDEGSDSPVDNGGPADDEGDVPVDD